MNSFFKSYLKKLTDSIKKLNSIIQFKKMNEVNEMSEPDVKKQKLETKTKEFPYQKKKVAMLLIYSGKGYLGMQRNPGFKTIEGDLLEAFVKAGVVRPDHIEQPGPKMSFQRAARTDKGVSAAGQVVSFKMFIDVENAIEKINQNLPAQIRVVGLVKVSKGFDSKKNCDARTYSYLTPTFAFAPITEKVTESYRITEKELNEVDRILKRFNGTHNFHNFTSGKLFSDPSAKRYIKEFGIGLPFVKDSLEYVTLTVKGQSFMIHHIRKMIGLTMAIMRGYASLSTIERCWLQEKVDVPKAPSLGLMLDKLHYDRYNIKFGSDGIHKALSWDMYHAEIEEFKNTFIYPTLFHEEKVEKSMLNWLSTLALHTYDVDMQRPGSSPMSRAKYLVDGPRKSPASVNSSGLVAANDDKEDDNDEGGDDNDKKDNNGLDMSLDTTPNNNNPHTDSVENRSSSIYSSTERNTVLHQSAGAIGHIHTDAGKDNRGHLLATDANGEIVESKDTDCSASVNEVESDLVGKEKISR